MSPATYLNGTLRPKGETAPELLRAPVTSAWTTTSPRSPARRRRRTRRRTAADNGFAFANVTPGTPDANQAANPGQVDGEGCVYPAAVPTIAAQLDAKYPPNPTIARGRLASLRTGHGQHADS